MPHYPSQKKKKKKERRKERKTGNCSCFQRFQRLREKYLLTYCDACPWNFLNTWKHLLCLSSWDCKGLLDSTWLCVPHRRMRRRSDTYKLCRIKNQRFCTSRWAGEVWLFRHAKNFRKFSGKFSLPRGSFEQKGRHVSRVRREKICSIEYKYWMHKLISCFWFQASMISSIRVSIALNCSTNGNY
jgi:hypothetical protein